LLRKFSSVLAALILISHEVGVNAKVSEKEIQVNYRMSVSDSYNVVISEFTLS